MGMSERAKAGRQHSSRMVSWRRSTQPLEFGPAGLDEALAGAELIDGVAEVLGPELGAVVGADLFELPAGRLELSGDAVEQLAGVAGAGVALGGAQLGPGVGGGDVDRRVLPDGALGARQPAHIEAVELDLLAGLRGLDVQLRWLLGRSALIGVAVAGHQRQALAPGV